ncbi:PorP/SprF family type IX secretion system membrane protein [Pedobacter chitinilyticus]|uniref:Type IX secretion system membrane protein PorP/SprF n=1 Tax=Pedobacter chitinilyticus TaxID=2233776 RepID=A0A443Z0K2_9SPHI|nr:type IX secretion system membrane protein PorP/SprF [Pedobacter chitinilyticus]RWU10062.1 type IX secretion system membrane protein PorP/SprF [Pedobacter chitinilyticus]
MRLTLLFLFLWLASFCSYGQEYPRSSQYIFNNYLLNPALSGIDSYIDLKLGHRQQWSGLEGAPSTQYISVNTAIGDDYIRSSINSFPGRGYNPLSRSYVNSYTAAEPHHGFGLIAVTDKAGLVRQNNVNATYAYHLGLTTDMNLSVGVSGGFHSLTVKVEDIRAEHETDPLFNADYNNLLRPDLGFGVWLYGPRFYVGTSAKQVLGKRSVFKDQGYSVLAYQSPSFYGTVGVKLFLDEEIAMIPSMLVSYWKNSPMAIDLNMKLAYQDKFWLAGSLRYNDAFSFLAGFNLSSLVNLTYSYDMSTTAIRRVNKGTHEIGIGFLLNNTYEVKCSTRQF